MSAAISTGPDAELVNLSQGGALLEVAGRLSLGSAVRLKLIKAGGDIAVVSGKVAWQKVASIVSGQINYRIAIAFDVPLDAAVLADGEAPAPPADEEPGEREPEPERSSAVVPFPTAPPKPQPATAPRPAPVASSAEVEDLRRKLGAAKADLSCQAAILESLAAKLKDSEQQRTALIRQLADAMKRGDDLQAMLDAREEERAKALREQQGKHEAIVAELLKAAEDQQAQYRVLFERHEEDESRLREQQQGHEAIVAELLKAADDQQAQYRVLFERHEEVESRLREQQQGHEAIVAELLKAAEDQQAQYRVLFERHAEDESRLRELAERLETAEALCGAQQDRYRALRGETEKLMRMIDAAAECGPAMEETKAS